MVQLLHHVWLFAIHGLQDNRLPSPSPTPERNKERKNESEVTQSSLTLCDHMDCCLPGSSVHGIFQARILEWVAISFSRSLLKLMSIASVMPSNHLILYHPLLLPSSNFPSIRVFSSESVLHIRWPKYWSFSFTLSPSNEYSGLVSFRMDWLDLLAVQGTLKSLLQHHSSKASSVQHSTFFIVQLSHPYMTTGKTIALTRQTFVGKMMSLLFSMVSRCHSFSYKVQASINFMAAVTICSDFRVPQNKVSHSLHCLSIYLPWSDGTGCHDLSFLNVAL